MKEEDNERKVYDELFEHAITLIQDHPPELVAGSMMAIAQRLYRTALNDQEYERMMDVVRDAPVRPYKAEKVRLH